MNRPIGEKVSVCLLSFNHANVIESTLRSVLSQTAEGFEFVVSDDCSTDGTWEKILALSLEDNRIHPIRTSRNLGMAGNANFAVSKSGRPYIALLHHDDIYRKDLLEKWAGVLESFPDVGFVFNPYDLPGAERHYGMPFTTGRLNGKWFLEQVLLAHWGCPVRGTAMIRRSFWDKVSGMREQFELLADVDLWMRLARVSAVGYVNEALIQPRVCRPDYYPDIYTGKSWHWRRVALLYEIHADNRLTHFPLDNSISKLKWLRFRVALNLETTKWLLYAVVKKKPQIIEASEESVTPYDTWALRALRAALQRLYRPPARASN